jgi:hypothetical protein
MYNPQEIITIDGKEIESEQNNINFYQQKHWFSTWYDAHVKAIKTKHNTFQEVMSLEDYFFRYDRGCFWMASHKLKHNIFNRLVYGAFLTSDFMYQKTLTSTTEEKREKRKIIQDIMIPRQYFLKMINFINRKIGIFPLWILPMKQINKSKELFGLPIINDYYINIGIYGGVDGDAIAIKRELEILLLEIGGRMVLHSECYYSKDEFWGKCYDKKEYTRLRKKYFAEGKFVDIYDKVSAFYAKNNKM